MQSHPDEMLSAPVLLPQYYLKSLVCSLFEQALDEIDKWVCA